MVPLGGGVAGLVVDGDEIVGATVAAAVDGREEGAPPGVLSIVILRPAISNCFVVIATCIPPYVEDAGLSR